MNVQATEQHALFVLEKPDIRTPHGHDQWMAFCSDVPAAVTAASKIGDAVWLLSLATDLSFFVDLAHHAGKYAIPYTVAFLSEAPIWIASKSNP